MNETFRDKCKLFRERLDILNNLLIELKEKIIIQDLSKNLKTPINSGKQLITNINWLEEVYVNGEIFSFINKTSNKYYSYVVYTKKEYQTVGLGLMYKNTLISPHFDADVESIITKYSDEELIEISKLIDEVIISINRDINYLKSNQDIQIHEHYYGEYNKGFESNYNYKSISDVINDYKNR